MNRHVLKVWPEFFVALCDGRKSFEIRKNDRNFQVGDELLLREWNPNTESFTGSWVMRRVTYITSAFQMEGYVVMAIEVGRVTTWSNNENPFS